jgi:hypothetical protein
VGHGTNNLGEFKALFYLMKLAIKKNILNIQVFGDFGLSINWMVGKIQVKENFLLSLALHLKDITGHFRVISFSHVYKEQNQITDCLSKEGTVRGVLVAEISREIVLQPI